MQRVQLGRTGPVVGRLGVGTCFMAGAGQAEVDRMVRTSLDLGMTHFDSAPDYGKGRDETMLGAALVGVRDRAMLATKVGYTSEANGHRDAAALMRQLDGSLARLQTDHVDLIQIHEADFLKWWTDDALNLDQLRSHGGERLDMEAEYDFANSPAAQFLVDARRAGKARYVGLTGKNARRLARIVADVQIDTLMLAHDHNIILRNGAHFLFPLLQERGIGLILAAVLMKGWLAVPQRQWKQERPAWMTVEFETAYDNYLAIAADAGIPLVELSLRWLLGEPAMHDVLVGCATAAEAQQNAAIIEKGPLTADLQQAINAVGIIHPLIYQGRSDL